MAICNMPKISIGMPVYNGERHIRQAIDSLLAQDYDDFEIIISDNASTDRTQEFCLEYAARDKRIRYYRNYTNMGITWNFNRVFELATSQYFMWAAHDDFRDSRYIRMCLESFQISDDIVLVHTWFEWIDNKTEELIMINKGITTIGMSSLMRFKLIASQMSIMGGVVYGIYKTSSLRKLMPLNKVWAADILLVAELSLHGDFITLPITLMFERSGGTSADLKGYCKVPENVSSPLFRRFPILGRLIHTQKIVFRSAKFSIVEKIKLFCYFICDHIYCACLRIADKLCKVLLSLMLDTALRTCGLWYKLVRGGGGTRKCEMRDDKDNNTTWSNIRTH